MFFHISFQILDLLRYSFEIIERPSSRVRRQPVPQTIVFRGLSSPVIELFAQHFLHNAGVKAVIAFHQDRAQFGR